MEVSDIIRPQWRWFLAWCLVGFLLGFGVTALGLFTLPAALILGIYLLRQRRGVEILGCPAGMGVALAVFGALNLDYQPCTSDSHRLVLAPGDAVSSYNCGGLNGEVFLPLGLAVLATSIGVFFWRTRRQINPQT